MKTRRTYITHVLKTDHEYFEDVWRGVKTFDVRRDDRDFQIGDRLRLQDWDENKQTRSGMEIIADVVYTMRNTPPYTPDGYVIMAIDVHHMEYHDGNVSVTFEKVHCENCPETRYLKENA